MDLDYSPQLKVIRIDGSIFFGAVNHIAEELDKLRKQAPEQCHILVIGSDINFIDVAGCEMLATEAHSLHLTGGKLYLSGLKGEVLEVLRREPSILKLNCLPFAKGTTFRGLISCG